MFPICCSPGPRAWTLLGSPMAFATFTMKGLLSMSCPANSTFTWGELEHTGHKAGSCQPLHVAHQLSMLSNIQSLGLLLTWCKPSTLGR